MTVRERSRLRPQLLETMGWRYIPLWTIDVFSDPASIASTMARYLGLDGPANTENHREDDMGADEQDNGQTAQEETSAAGRHAADMGAGASAGGIAGQGTEAVLPTRSRDDDPRGWGDTEGNHDQWLREQRPPHWG